MKTKLNKRQRLTAVRRLLAGKSAKKVAADFGVCRSLLYRFRKQYLLANRNPDSLAVAGKTAMKVRHPKLSVSQRLTVLKEVEDGVSVASACRRWGISRTIFYRLKKRYEAAGSDERMSVLENRSSRPKRLRNLIPKGLEGRILDLVVKRPELSTHKISALLADESGNLLISNKGVQNVFRRNNLGTYEQRLAFSRLSEEAWKPNIKLSDLPYIPLRIWRMLFAPFATIPKLGWLFTRGQIFLLFIVFFSFYFYKVVAAIVTSPTGNPVGTFFASISLTFGLFFLIYSMKYYMGGFLVLKLARGGGNQGQSGRSRFAELLNKFGFNFAKRQTVNPLNINLEKVELGAQRPFVSVHVALYNEKRVVGRLINACTSLMWTVGKGNVNYEVIIADDSTDETTEIAKQTLKSLGFTVNSSQTEQTEATVNREPSTQNLEEEIFVFTKSGAPKVTIIHRFKRDGFKGAALQRALVNTDKRAQYIAVFDADFVPYPDTIEQFIKTFQVLTTNDERLKTKAEQEQALDVSHSALSDNIAAVQGYQWHVLNKGANWITRGVRTEYAGSYVIERASEEIYQGLKQIAGSVFCIRADVIRKFGWGTSITEDFELTLKLYEAGYKVAFTPYIQGPAEAVSTIKTLIRQRMRWAEGASFNVKLMFGRMLKSPHLSRAEKLEFVYLAPYYLQAAFFIVGTLCWFLSEAVFGSRLPFWTVAFGWSLVFTNMLALPLMNIVGLFLEESEERDYVGILSFVALSYILVPFQAYAAVKGFTEKEEGPWFRTPKTGTITDTFGRSHFTKFFGNIFGRPAGVPISTDLNRLAPIGLSAFNPLQGANFRVRPRHFRLAGNLALAFVLAITVLLSMAAPFIPQTSTLAQTPQVKTLGEGVEGIEGMGGQSAFAEASTDTEVLVDESADKEGLGEEISKSRLVSKITRDGRKVEYIFEKEPVVRVKIGGYEIEFETKEVGGRAVDPQVAKIYGEKQVIYEEAVAGIDIKYTINEGLIIEEFILKDRKAAEVVGDKITQNIRTVGVKVVSPDPSAFGFYTDSGKELFKLSQPFAKDDDGSVTNDLVLRLEKDYIGHKLTKTIGSSAQEWLRDPIRAYPVAIDPSIVTGGVDSDEVTYGGLQRKLAYVNSNWYAFYNCDANPCTSGGTTGKVYFQKSSNGTDWGGYVDVDSTDTDNFNPSISVSGTTIIVFWVDDGANLAEGKTITTGADTLGTLCQTGSEATADPSFMVTVAAVSATQAVVAISDTAADTDFGVYIPDTLDGTCANATTARETGNISLGSGLTGLDRPVVVPLSSTKVAMVFQDGDLSYSELNLMATVADSQWTTNNLQIANVADNIYSVTTDAAATPKVWILTANISDATDTNFYTCCTTDFTNVQVDSDAGANGDDADDDINIYCVASNDCKIVYIDDRDDTTAPNLIFVDCGDETCTSGGATVTTLDADYGDAGDTPGADIYCVATDNCKVAYFDVLDGGSPDLLVLDCSDAGCTSPTIGTVDTDVGGTASTAAISIDCTGGDTDCKVLYNDGQSSDLDFVDCGDAQCTAANATITIFDGTTGTYPKNDMTCATGVTDCKFIYHDTNATGGCADADSICFVDCGAAACTGTAQTVFDADVSGTTGQVPSAIWCLATDGADCRVAYGDGQDTDFYFVDCGSTSCASSTITTVDSTGGSDASNDPSVSMDCISVADCKVTYVADLTSTAEKLYFLNCDSNACSSGDEVIEIPGAPRFAAAVDCPTTGNCKTVVVDGGTGAAPTVEFYDCANANGDCFPSVTDDTDPWAAGGGDAGNNIETVTLTYNSGDSSLYASVIMDASNQAYYKSAPVSSIAWTPSGTGTSWAFTAGALNEISSPETVTAEAQVAVVLNRTDANGNFEFANVPEKTFLLLVPVGYLVWKRRRRRRSP